MQKQLLLQALQNIGIVKFGQFTLKSGVQSPVYIDLRAIIAYPTVLREVANTMWETVAELQPDLICGIPYSALPIATCIAVDQQLPMLLWRKEAKDYGTQQRIEGIFVPGQTCLVVEDVITMAGSVLQTIEGLEQAGLIVRDVLALVDRQQGGREHLKQGGYCLHTVFTLNEICSF